MSNESLQVLRYLVNKYGLSEGLRRYYPQLLKTDPELMHLLVNYESAERALQARVQELQDLADESL